MNFFKKKIKNISEENSVKDKSKRNLLLKPAGIISAAASGLTIEDLKSVKSKTGFIYLKQNGEIINDYVPRGGSDPYLGSIIKVGFNFAPPGWAACNGQILPIGSYNSLFTLIGNTYGGDGITTFGLPDFRGRVPIHKGQGTGLTNRVMGEAAGTETVSLTLSQIPSHSHSVNVNTNAGTTSSPDNAYIAQNADGISAFALSANAAMPSGATGATGSGNGHSNIMPYQVLNFIIAVEGIFPFFP